MNVPPTLTALSLLVAVWLLPSAASAEEASSGPPLVGLLEEKAGERFARACFRRSAAGWEAVPVEQQATSLADTQGAGVGVLAWHAAGDPDRPSAGRGAGSGARPVVVGTRPNVVDPERWTPISPEHLSASSFVAMLTTYWHFGYCAGMERSAGLLFAESYKSYIDLLLVAVDIPVSAGLCDADGKPFSGKVWFRRSRRGDGAVLGINMSLVSIGDYDGDGASEVVFSTPDADGHGYALFWDRLLHRVACRGSRR
jgi:hypothetical protein